MTRTALILIACLPASLTQGAAPDMPREAIVAHFASGAEPRVEAATWSPRNVLNLGVHYMGADETALARQTCRLLADHGLARGMRVRVIDINTMGADPARWEVAGEAKCP